MVSNGYEGLHELVQGGFSQVGCGSLQAPAPAFCCLL